MYSPPTLPKRTFSLLFRFFEITCMLPSLLSVPIPSPLLSMSKGVGALLGLGVGSSEEVGGRHFGGPSDSVLVKTTFCNLLPI